MSFRHHALSRRSLYRALAFSFCAHALLLVGVSVVERPALSEAQGGVRVQASLRDSGAVAGGMRESALPKSPVPAPVVSSPLHRSAEPRAAELKPERALRPLAVPQEAPVAVTAPAEPASGPPAVDSLSGAGAGRRTKVAGGVGGESAARGGDAVAGEGAAGAGASVAAEDMRHYRVALASAAKRFKRYPPLARERGWEGTVEVAVLLHASIPRPEVKLVRTSGRELLDTQALEMLAQAVRVAELPQGLRGRDLRIDLPVRFSLEDER